MKTVMQVKWIYVSIALLGLVLRHGVSAAYMEGFQPSQLSSTPMEKKDDTFVDIVLNTPFPFYNKLYTDIFVNEDGLLTFGAQVPVGGSTRLPIIDLDGSDSVNSPLERMVLISPFWTEVKTDNAGSTGTVYYRKGLSRNDQALLDAEGIVKACYFDQDMFRATDGVVVTWDQVSDVTTTKKNSFQAILVYDRYRSFVIFHYSEMQYVKPSGFSAIGFSTGDNFGGLSYPVIDEFEFLPDRTNCDRAGIKGVYVFRVDSDRISSSGCQVTKQYYALQVSPASGPMMGGNRISIAPNCDLTEKAVCVFQMGDTVKQTVTDVQILDSAVVCIPGPFFITGEVSIMVYRSIEDAEETTVIASYIVKYTIEHPDDTKVGVSRSSPDSNSWNFAGSRLTIIWDSTLFQSSSDSPGDFLPMLSVSIMQYDESQSGQIPTWADVYDLGMDVDNSGSFTFTAVSLENITEANPWGVIRVMSMDMFPVSLYSDVHMLGYLLHEQYQDDPTGWAGDECTRWDGSEDASNDEDGMPSFLSDVPACPCTLEQVRWNTGGFMEQTGGCALDVNDPSCTRQAQSNRICFLSTNHEVGAECCYDSVDGYLVFSLDDPTGGTSDKASILGQPPYALPGQTPYLSHWLADVVPYQLCCRWAEPENCRTYLENRWPKDCVEYDEKEMGFIFGDPHFITFDQRRFTFNGIGEYRLMEVSGVDFKLYGRTKMASPVDMMGVPVASYLNAVVMQEAGSDTIHIELGQIRPLTLYYNMGTVFRQPDMWLQSNRYDPLYLRGATLTVNVDFTQITVSFHASSIVVIVRAYADSITAEIIASRATIGPTASVEGLLGDMDGISDNDIRGADGQIYEGDDPSVLFETLKEWITTGDTLFHTDGLLTSMDYQNETFVPILVTPDPSTLDESISSRLEEICQGLEECVYDMSVTQTIQSGEECFEENEVYLATRKIMEKIPTCPYLPGPVDGSMEFSDPLQRYASGTTITFNCDDPKSILYGPRTRDCVVEDDIAFWSDNTIPVCTVTDCSTDDVKGADVISTKTDSEGNLQVTFGCPNSEIRYELTCKGGQWDGARADCSTGGGGLGGGAIAGIIIAVLIVLALVILGVLYFLRQGSGTKDLERSGTKVNENQPAENWGMEQEAADAMASKQQGRGKEETV